MAAGKKKKKGNAWEDHLTRKARSENYPARSVYKLKEIQKKFQVMKKKDSVMDLGCSPGSWLLYAGEVIGPAGTVLGVDLKPVDIYLPAHVSAIQGDIMDSEWMPEKDKRFHTVLSDMAPATTGRKDVDALRSVELCEMALESARGALVPGGNFVCKIFQGNEFAAFQKKVKKYFKSCKVFKPESCRKQSKEIYIIAKDRK